MKRVLIIKSPESITVAMETSKVSPLVTASSDLRPDYSWPVNPSNLLLARELEPIATFPADRKQCAVAVAEAMSVALDITIACGK
jgi:hypothetical protein